MKTAYEAYLEIEAAHQKRLKRLDQSEAFARAIVWAAMAFFILGPIVVYLFPIHAGKR